MRLVLLIGALFMSQAASAQTVQTPDAPAPPAVSSMHSTSLPLTRIPLRRNLFSTMRPRWRSTVGRTAGGLPSPYGEHLKPLACFVTKKSWPCRLWHTPAASIANEKDEGEVASGDLHRRRGIVSHSCMERAPRQKP